MYLSTGRTALSCAICLLSQVGELWVVVHVVPFAQLVLLDLSTGSKAAQDIAALCLLDADISEW